MSTSSDPIITDHRRGDQERIQMDHPGSGLSSSGSDPPPRHQPSDEETPPSKDYETTQSLVGDVGFRTPTSSPHRIPEVRPCPHAPKKPTPRLMGRKRKNSLDDVVWSNGGGEYCRIPILLDLTNEVEAMFPPVLLASLRSKIKKARRF